MKEIASMFHIGESILPRGLNERSIVLKCITDRSKDAIIEFRIPYIEVTTIGWVWENIDDYQYGCVPKVAGPIEIRITSPMAYDDSSILRVSIEGFYDFLVSVYLACSDGESHIYHCSMVDPVLRTSHKCK